MNMHSATQMMVYQGPIKPTQQPMEAYQQRVINEKRELDERLARLHKFITEPSPYDTLPARQQTLLIFQSQTMATYSRILGERIKLWHIVPIPDDAPRHTLD
jgi:hypothetical protein